MTAALSPRLRAHPGVAVEPQPKPARWSFEWSYFVVVFAAWCFVPLLRRLLDFHNGFYNPVQITSTIPFVMTLPLALVCFRRDRLARLSPALKVFAWVWAAAVAYGLIVALAGGTTVSAVYEAVQYLVPMLLGIWLAGQDIATPQLMQRLTRIILCFGAAVAAYGLAQFVHPAPWDALWVQSGDFTSIGPPNPFQMRVFSTLNSPGPAADFFAMSIILALPFLALKRLWIWPFVGLLGAAQLLTLVRESWIALIIGVIFYLLCSPTRLRTLPFISVFGILLALLIVSLPAFLGAGQDSDVVTARISTLADVGHDPSALARTYEIQTAIQQGLDDPIGEGLGQLGSASVLSANPNTVHGNVLDSGYLARFLELGWLGFCGYAFVVFGSLGAMLVTLLRPTRAPKSRETLVVLSATAAMCAALVWADAAGDAHLGLDGVFFWIALGIGLRPMPPAPAPPAPDRRLRSVTT